MMRIEDVQSVLARDPFVPLRVRKSDGKSVDIPFRHVAIVLKSQGLLVFKGVKDAHSRQAKAYEVIRFERIERIEPKSKRAGRSRN